jgi:hypothetical protein
VNISASPLFTGLISRILLLSYGGVALLQWVHVALSSSGSNAIDVPGPAQWLRDGTLALPFVAGVVLLGMRRTQAGTLVTVALYSTLMGGAFLLGNTLPGGTGAAHAEHEVGSISTLDLFQHALVIMLATALYAAVVDMIATALQGTIEPQSGPATRNTQYAIRTRLVLPLVAIVAIASAFLFSKSSPVAAQTTFPDQVIHPRGTLLLVAKNPSDGSMAFIAPDYGPNGVRPTIEMTEGEVLNITLKNELTSDVSLHVHGVHYNLDSDGTRHSGSFVKPGQQRVYQWRAAVGTSGYWHYHDHVIGDDEGTIGILNGLYGGLIVRKPGDPKPAHTFVIVGNDKTLNGRIYPDTPTYVAKQGELVEWIVISHGNRVHTFHLHAHRWLTPNRTSDPNSTLPANVGSGHEDNHILAPGDSFGFLVIAGDDVGPGMWMYHCHFQDHAASMKGFFKVLPSGASSDPAQVPTSRVFPETGKTVSGRFLEYWTANGGLAQQGYPISEPFMEKSDTDGKTYQVQYFERSVFEAHPENKPPYDVLLSQLGTFRYKEKYQGGK